MTSWGSLVAAAVVAVAGQTQGRRSYSSGTPARSTPCTRTASASGSRAAATRRSRRTESGWRSCGTAPCTSSSGRAAGWREWPRAASRRGQPDGRLAYTASDGVRIGARIVAPGASGPAWAADGRLAVVLPEGIWVAGALAVPGGRSPAWGPEGRLAYVMEDGVQVDGSLVIADGRQPAWNGAGRLTAAVADGIAVEGAGIVPGTRPGDAAPSWGSLAPKPKVDPNDFLPDLDQRAPSRLSIAGWGGGYRLGFTSATDNVGRGPIWIRGARTGSEMRADQVVERRRGGTRVVRGVGRIRFDGAHDHWHMMRFQQFELRRASDFSLLVRDRKTGFCLGDHYGLARGRLTGFRGPRFFGNCAPGDRRRASLEMGTSIGYTDRYPAHFHGQNLDLTGVPAGIYVLVHRANPTGAIRELRYDNNAASLRIRIAWPSGRKSTPTVRVLRTCPGSERC